ncbi:SigE family RNA polymerase sigma factor [Longispora albida]|uniref:SigE family RNA polymerase sigma factor n=1 Tax=Longispora albida TaxID=203523 RepID=UPI0003640DF4|nr:SigE family RNA polymerase sigma factor [Longispora albida]
MTFDEFASARLDALLRYAVMLTGDRHLAQDVVQETMIRVQLKWRKVASAGRPEAYVRRMLTNVYLDWRRGSWWQRVVFGHPDRTPPESTGGARQGGWLGTATQPDHAVLAAERDEMWARLATLPRRQRAAVVLRYYESLTDDEIAEVLDCAVGTVRSSISRALAALRTELVPAPTGGKR